MQRLNIKWLSVFKDALRILLIFSLAAALWMVAMFLINFVFGYPPEAPEGSAYQIPALYLWSAIGVGVIAPVYGFYKAARSNPEGGFVHLLIVGFVLCWVYPIVFHGYVIDFEIMFFNALYVFCCMLFGYALYLNKERVKKI